MTKVALWPLSSSPAESGGGERQAERGKEKKKGKAERKLRCTSVNQLAIIEVATIELSAIWRYCCYCCKCTTSILSLSLCNCSHAQMCISLFDLASVFIYRINSHKTSNSTHANKNRREQDKHCNEVPPH